MAMKKALVPIHGGVLSALGMVVADQGRQFSKTLSLDVQQIDEQSLEEQFAQLELGGMEQLALEGLDSSALVSKRSADFRYKGQSYTLNIDWHALAEMLDAFEQLHRQRYGYSHDAPIELLTIRVNLSTAKTPFALPPLVTGGDCNKFDTARSMESLSRQSYWRAQICIRGNQLRACIITEYSATTFVATNCQ